MTIGRDPSSTIQIEDPEISRLHLRLKKRGRLHIIEDLESRNGTQLNGEKIINAIIQNGDKVMIGNTELLFSATAPDYFISSEMINFEMSSKPESGLYKPISLDREIDQGLFAPRRLNLRSDIDELTKNIDVTQKIFAYSGDLLVKNDLEDALSTVLKIIGQNLGNVSRAVALITHKQQRKLVPAAIRHFNGDKESFSVSHRAIQDVLTNKQPVIVESSNPTATTLGPTRAIIPIISNGNVIALIHLESAQNLRLFQQRELALVQAIISRISPVIDNILLRNELDAWMIGVVDAMIATIEAKDTYTVGHSERVCKYSMAIAEQLKLSRDIKKQLMISSLCHDIGKVGIPDQILKKASLLTHEEYEEMKLHPTIGAKIIEHMPGAERFLSGVKYHHEKWDGTGYPEGLEGEDIPFFGRIVAIADAFDAMISGRAYSGFMDESDAVDQLSKETDLFDPEILKAFEKAWDDGILTPKTGTKAKS